jgi:hypothetical protein
MSAANVRGDSKSRGLMIPAEAHQQESSLPDMGQFESDRGMVSVLSL